MNTNRLKILFLPAWYPSVDNPFQGIFVKEHAKAAAIFNDIVVLYAYPGEVLHTLRPYYVYDNIEDGIRTIRVKHRGIAYYWSILATFHNLITEGWKPDIIHAHVYSAGEAALMLGRLYKIPVIITEHSTMIATHSVPKREKYRMQLVMNKAHLILPVSEDLGRSIKDYYGIRTKIRIVPNTVNSTLYHYTRKQNKTDLKKRMLAVCFLTSRKGIDFLLEALEQLSKNRRDFLLDIVGDGPNREEYEKLSNKLGLGDIVTFHGRQPEIVSFMQSCDFFVLPSMYENFGVVYIEAMASGKPVIATDAGGPREIVNEDVGILVPPRNVDILKQAIEYMLDNYQIYSPEKIAQYAKTNFSYEVVGNLLDNVYRDVLAN
jgi:glycosyltransferase involved in cell wall biosynthesis